MNPFQTRRVFAAAHVSARDAETIDWERTLERRSRLWSLGFGVAEAMDTAQRGGALLPGQALDLIRRTGVEARATGALWCAGVATDALPVTATPAEIIDAYREQLAFVGAQGATPVLMASRALAARATDASAYAEVYDAVLAAAPCPVILHWLGPMFDPALRGYWGSDEPERALAALLEIVHRHAHAIDGIKISMLDDELEVRLRRSLPANVRCYTGDDFHYAPLILGDEHGHSDALLGIFDGIAPRASEAFRALDRGDAQAFTRALAPTVPLARHLFAAPTSAYKTGLVFLAYCNGEEERFVMLGGDEHRRDATHLARAFDLAREAGCFDDEERARAQARAVLAEAVA